LIIINFIFSVFFFFFTPFPTFPQGGRSVHFPLGEKERGLILQTETYLKMISAAKLTK